ncbi:biotin--[acetyl-CoA-carboxylase] ligase [Tissierella sp. Yu-01]|uniref:biotin--[acetyl-CoA-carboxylase] ligase n=1 Tax=Tissierella sp. Yu-01 TaxID=3035694 RepID=UPI00240D37A4|nr:biotin--[acetyl-CoA-carboxylase] ligase [Tissierella sp. Yu-01]WFA07739.1 biotin--[acetyl-CoA-carboxylase] ligase [Tissierella sp. Yu-01]
MKYKILRLLKKREGFISGESISKEFGVTRAAIWKSINSLKEDGYKIESITNKGYRLLSSPDILTCEEIGEYLNTRFIGNNIYYYDSIDSTNKMAKDIAFEKGEGVVIVSEEQLEGRGRLGRTWVSPKKKGIYFSIVLKPQLPPTKIAKLTLIGAAAVNLAFKEIGIESQIKWPNDIVINGKKVCGILTEMNSELNMINYVIIGIGINVNLKENEIPEDIKHKATSLKIESKGEIDRKRLFATILNKFEELYIPFNDDGDIVKTIEICRNNSAVIGKEILLVNGSTKSLGKALDINEAGELIVEFEDGKIESIFSGEISIRGLEGYI